MARVSTPRRHRGRLPSLTLALALGGTALGATACAADRAARSPDGPVSDSDANRYIRRAIRSSSEGVILLPSQRAEQVYELPRLNEIAQTLRGPAARCFLVRAIETMEPAAASGSGERGRGYDHVPEGQIKVRVRVAASGEVMRTEVLESGFLDEQMEPCLRTVLQEQRWPPNKSGNAHFIDVVYWVSLGMQRDLHSEELATHLRREQVSAGRRGKACLQGRVDAGRYEVGGLNLIDREGATMVNRIDTGELPEPIRACLATALRDIRLPRDANAFVRPVSPRVVFEIGRDGSVTVEGESWLELVELEERARRAAEREALVAEEPDALVDELPPRRPPQAGVGISAGAAGVAGSPAPASPAPDSPSEGPGEGPGEGRSPREGDPSPDPPPADDPAQDPVDDPAEDRAQDPGKGGLRLDLGGRRRGDDA